MHIYQVISGRGFLFREYIRAFAISYKKDPMSTLNGPLVSLILKVALLGLIGNVQPLFVVCAC